MVLIKSFVKSQKDIDELSKQETEIDEQIKNVQV